MCRIVRTTSLFFAFLILALLPAACSSGAPPSPTGPPTIQPPTLGVISTLSLGLTPTPARELAADQVLRRVGGEPTNIDPQASNAEVTNDSYIMLAFENLLAFGPDGELLPAAAEAMPTVSPDGYKYTFKLRPGLKFSDGAPLMARHFEFGWKRMLDPTVASGIAYYGYAVKGAEAYSSADPKKVSTEELQKLRDAVGVKALDDLTLEFTLEKPASWFPSILALWVGLPGREDLLVKFGTKWTEPGNYVGNGPYILKEWQHSTKMVYEANPNYRLGPPTLRRIEFTQLADASLAFTAYRNNEIDMVGVGSDQMPLVQEDEELKQQLKTAAGTCTWMIILNHKKKPFDDVRVRKAFAMALDREVLVNSIYKGVGAAAYQLVPPGQPGYYADLKTYKFDPAAAKSLLAEAGYPDGKGLPPIRLSFTTGDFGKETQFVQAQLKDNLGVEIQLDPVEFKALLEMLNSTQKLNEMAISAWCQDFPDPYDWYSLVFNSKNTRGEVDGGWVNAEFDRLTEQADVELDAAKRQSLYHQAAQLFLDDMPVILLNSDLTAGMRKPWLRGCAFSAFNYSVCQTSIMDVYIARH